MKKVAARKKPGLIRKMVTAPAATIVAAAVGGLFSLTSALLPRVLPVKETAPMSAAPVSEPVAQAQVPIPIVLSVSVPAAPEHVATIPERSPAQDQPAPPLTIASSANASAKKIPKPIAFLAEKISSSLAQAEAKWPARADVRLRPAANHRPNLTYGVWTIFASQDIRGTLWNNSTLKITSQRETPDGLQIVGFLDWRVNGKCAGREYVVGNYVDDTRSLYLEGRSSAGADGKLALALAPPSFPPMVAA